MHFTPALAGRLSGRFQSCGTEIARHPARYAGVVSPASFFIPETDVLRPVVLGSMGVGGEAASPACSRAAGAMEGDLSPAGLESPRQRSGGSGCYRGTN